MSSDNRSIFTKFSSAVATITGRPITFLTAVAIVLIWALSGPFFDYSDTWQLVINTGTTIVTFLMVFLIQNTQNRDTAALQLKLDEIIKSLEEAGNEVLDVEDLDEKELEEKRKKMIALAEEARKELTSGTKKKISKAARGD
jgi:low affinity Fe/Cu permease